MERRGNHGVLVLFLSPFVLLWKCYALSASPIETRAEQHITAWDMVTGSETLIFPNRMNAERGLLEIPFALPSCLVHKAEENTYRSSRGELGKVLGFLRSREMAPSVVWFKLAQT